MKVFLFIPLLFLTSCAKHLTDRSDTIVSMQTVDRNGFTETVSNKERLKPMQSVDFNTPQPYKKVLRVYGRNAKGQSTSKITSYHENGHIWQYLDVVDGRAHGRYREWHSNGQLRIEAPVIEGVADINELAQSSWVFDGVSYVYDEEGFCMAEIPYEKGLLHGLSQYYFQDGTLQKIIPYEKGLVHGTLQVFDEKQRVIEEIPYVRDEKHGRATAFWEGEHLLYEEEYEADRLLRARYFDADRDCIAQIQGGEGKQAQFKNGFLHSLTTFHRGVPEGEIQVFHPNGALYRSWHILEGKKQGEEWEYYPAQKEETLRPKLYLTWHDDKIQGQVKTWYPDGQIESQREVTNNKKQGLCFAWYKSGDLMLVEEYELDRLLKGSYYKKGDKKVISKIEAGKGTATLYSAEGIFLRKVNYDRGRAQAEGNLLP